MLKRKKDDFKTLLTGLPHEIKQNIFSFFPYQKLTNIKSKKVKSKSNLNNHQATKLSQVSINYKDDTFFDIIKRIYHKESAKKLNIDFSIHNPELTDDKEKSKKWLDNYIFKARQSVMFEFRILQFQTNLFSNFINDHDIKTAVGNNVKQLSLHIKEIIFSQYQDHDYEEALNLQACLLDLYTKNENINVIKDTSNKNIGGEERFAIEFLQSPKTALAHFSGMKTAKCIGFSCLAFYMICEMLAISGTVYSVAMGTYHAINLANYNSTSGFDPQQADEGLQLQASIFLAIICFAFSIVFGGAGVALCCGLKKLKKLFNTKNRINVLNKEYTALSDEFDELVEIDIVAEAIQNVAQKNNEKKDASYDDWGNVSKEKQLKQKPNEIVIVIKDDVSENTPLLKNFYRK